MSIRNPYDAPESESRKQLKRPKTFAFIFTAVLSAIGTIMLCARSAGFVTGLFFVPFSLGPLLINLTQANFWMSRASQCILMLSSLAYAVWFGYAFIVYFWFGTDAQSALVLLFIGVYSLPVMIPVWIIAGLLNHYSIRPDVQAGSKQYG